MIGLLKDRASTVKEIADNAAMFYREPVIDPAALAQHVTETVRPALADLRQALSEVEWSKEAISAAFKATLTTPQAQDAASRHAGAPAGRGYHAHTVH